MVRPYPFVLWRSCLTCCGLYYRFIRIIMRWVMPALSMFSRSVIDNSRVVNEWCHNFECHFGSSIVLLELSIMILINGEASILLSLEKVALHARACTINLLGSSRVMPVLSMFSMGIVDNSRVVSKWRHSLESHLHSSIMLLVLSFTLLIFYATGLAAKSWWKSTIFCCLLVIQKTFYTYRPQPIHLLIDLNIYGMHI